MAYDLLGVCRLIVNYSNEKEYNISNLKLQKLPYYIQAYFLMDLRTYHPGCLYGVRAVRRVQYP